MSGNNTLQNDTTAQWFTVSTVDDSDRLSVLEKRVDSMQATITQLQNENLRLINRILEAEIAAERYRNLMLRKHISFPFSPMLNHAMDASSTSSPQQRAAKSSAFSPLSAIAAYVPLAQSSQLPQFDAIPKK